MRIFKLDWNWDVSFKYVQALMTIIFETNFQNQRMKNNCVNQFIAPCNMMKKVADESSLTI